jgi:hypothetical protein
MYMCYVPSRFVDAGPREGTATSVCVQFVFSVEGAIAIAVVDPFLGYDSFGIFGPSSQA